MGAERKRFNQTEISQFKILPGVDYVMDFLKVGLCRVTTVHPDFRAILHLKSSFLSFLSDWRSPTKCKILQSYYIILTLLISASSLQMTSV